MPLLFMNLADYSFILWILGNNSTVQYLACKVVEAKNLMLLESGKTFNLTVSFPLSMRL